MKVAQYINAAFGLAAQRHASIFDRWIALSLIGAGLPRSLLMPNIQRIGRLDILLRCLEEELIAVGGEARGDLGFDHLLHLSELWVGSAYEIFRVMDERGLVEKTPEFKQIKWDLSLLRMPLEKHELAGRKRTGVLEFWPIGEANVSDSAEVYDPDDPQRSFIMPTGLSSRGSASWAPYDHLAGSSRWIERRQIADAILSHWAPTLA
ncbi:hypothetical protein MKI84_07405 [Ancylobacter sp. A5.8]|uniref:hypothetical protein n=1 Tax=Ancylobacter gelatini TaxID=2919920 RepID=UPI001F4F0AED|nr:hypothetical protein [Ancylobacter gelatini]MCJ8142742.1 hypothetical protein [Ancylobacter gelatini]